MLESILTDRALIYSGIVDLVVPHSLWTVHGFIEHHQLHVLLLSHLLLHWVHAIGLVHAVLHLRIVITGLPKAHPGIFLLDEFRALSILKVTLLLVGLDGDVGVDTVEVFLLFSKH